MWITVKRCLFVTGILVIVAVLCGATWWGLTVYLGQVDQTSALKACNASPALRRKLERGLEREKHGAFADAVTMLQTATDDKASAGTDECVAAIEQAIRRIDAKRDDIFLNVAKQTRDITFGTAGYLPLIVGSALLIGLVLKTVDKYPRRNAVVVGRFRLRGDKITDREPQEQAFRERVISHLGSLRGHTGLNQLTRSLNLPTFLDGQDDSDKRLATSLTVLESSSPLPADAGKWMLAMLKLWRVLSGQCEFEITGEVENVDGTWAVRAIRTNVRERTVEAAYDVRGHDIPKPAFPETADSQFTSQALARGLACSIAFHEGNRQESGGKAERGLASWQELYCLSEAHSIIGDRSLDVAHAGYREHALALFEALTAEVAPGSTDAHQQLALLYLSLGRAKEARKTLQTLLARIAAPPSLVIKQVIDDLLGNDWEETRSRKWLRDRNPKALEEIQLLVKGGVCRDLPSKLRGILEREPPSTSFSAETRQQMVEDRRSSWKSMIEINEDVAIRREDLESDDPAPVNSALDELAQLFSTEVLDRVERNVNWLRMFSGKTLRTFDTELVELDKRTQPENSLTISRLLRYVKDHWNTSNWEAVNLCLDRLRNLVARPDRWRATMEIQRLLETEDWPRNDPKLSEITAWRERVKSENYLNSRFYLALSHFSIRTAEGLVECLTELTGLTGQIDTRNRRVRERLLTKVLCLKWNAIARLFLMVHSPKLGDHLEVISTLQEHGWKIHISDVKRLKDRITGDSQDDESEIENLRRTASDQRTGEELRCEALETLGLITLASRRCSASEVTHHLDPRHYLLQAQGLRQWPTTYLYLAEAELDEHSPDAALTESYLNFVRRHRPDDPLLHELERRAGDLVAELTNKKAYELWEAAGRPTGADKNFWFAAQEEIRGRRRTGEGAATGT